MDQERNVVASLALHAVLEPVFNEVSSSSRSCYNLLLTPQLEADDRNIAAVQTLRTAFTKVNYFLHVTPFRS